MSPEILIIKGNYNSFEKYYLEHMNAKNCTPSTYYNSRNKLSLCRKIWIHKSLPFEYIWYGDWRNELQKYDVIIIFDSIFSANIIEYINSHRRQDSRFIFWHWNIINMPLLETAFSQTKSMCEHWTFDYHDAQKYNMKLNNQFFFYQVPNKKLKKWDVYFVGSDKGRYGQLKDLHDTFNCLGISSKICVRKDKTTAQNGDLYISKAIPYDEILANVECCNCVLELCQEGQVGLTERALAAMFFEKKLITNNENIVNQGFYNEKNILLMRNGWQSQVNAFLQTPFWPIDKELLFPYSFEGWINRFLSYNN